MHRLVLLAVVVCAPRATAAAQQPLTRAQAVETALSRGARLAVARADTAAARAQLLTARALANPTLSAAYSKDVPQYHVSLELPLDFPWLRRGRIGSAEAARRAAGLRFTFERAAVALDADTTYTRALAAIAHARLSRRNAEDADTLRRLAAERRDAADASDLDVELATVNAGQQLNLAATDSMVVLSTLLDLQTVIGLADDHVAVVPTDSLAAPPADSAPDAPRGAGSLPGARATTLSVAAAEQAVAATELALRVQRRSVFGVPAVTAGFDAHDPAGEETGLLPTVGVALPLPFLDRNRGPIAQAQAEQLRAQAELALARLESAAGIARATRQRDIALAKVARDRLLVVSANRVAALSLVAYREGASALPNVLEAQRNAREILGQYIDDLAEAWVASATLRVLSLTTTPTGPSR